MYVYMYVCNYICNYVYVEDEGNTYHNSFLSFFYPRTRPLFNPKIHPSDD